MVSSLLYYQLALLAIIWLFVMLHVTWSEPGVDRKFKALLAPPRRSCLLYGGAQYC